MFVRIHMDLSRFSAAINFEPSSEPNKSPKMVIVKASNQSW